MDELQIRLMQIARAKEEIRCCNALNQIYGLVLTEGDITELVELRGQALRSTGRVEFGAGILPKLMRAFCKSPYVDRCNYAATLGDLQEAFYYFKNESEDRFSDEELIDFMETVFNGQAHGSAEVLTTISLEDLWDRLPDGTLNQCDQLLMNGIGKTLLNTGLNPLTFAPEERAKLFHILREATEDTLRTAAERLSCWLNLREANARGYVLAVLPRLRPWTGKHMEEKGLDNLFL